MSQRLIQLLLALCLAACGAAGHAQTAAAPSAAAPTAAERNAEPAKPQPDNNAPPLRTVRDPSDQSGFTTLPGVDKGVLIQPPVKFPGVEATNAGEAWRQLRNQWLLPYGGWMLVGVVAVIALFYWRVGPLGHHEMGEKRTIERFTLFERTVHWTNAIAFVTLGISGIVMSFGKFILLPILGGTLFGWITYALKTVHNFAGPVFAVTLLMVIFTFLRDELPKAHDWGWLKKGGGYLQGQEVPSHRFNAGEKILYWGGMVLLGVIVVASGLVLDKLVPGVAYTRGVMQIANIVHVVSTILMMVALIGHIYLGSVGMRGAYTGMRTGYVDEGWAKEHHELWYDDIKAGRIPAQRSAPDAQPEPKTKTV